ncbi:hypothetical protein [Arcticibacter sp.]|jgi:hypothetical protein|uniref:hypothetical protein n=1 Tax=Arcticibacter sp. TaxID=1872630 RepID=UPI00388E2DA4
MTNNQSKKPEKLEPQDSEQKDIKPDRDDNKAVVHPEDLNYEKEDARFKDPAKTKETSEQPVNPIKTPPRDK